MTRHRAAMLAGVLFLALGTPVVATWGGFRQAAKRAATEQAALVADQAARRLEDFTRSRLLVLEAVRQDVQAGYTSDRESFLAHTRSLERELGGFKAINWIDGDGVIRWVSPLATNEAAVGRDVFDHPVAGEILRAAQETGQPHMTPPLDLFQGGRAFTTYYPVLGSDDRPASYVNGVFLIDTLVRGSLSRGVLDSYDVAIRDEGAVVFGSRKAVAERAQDSVSGESVVDLLGRRWNMQVAPKATTWTAMRGESHLVFLVGGLALAVALVLLLYVVLLRQIQQREALEERRALEAQLEQARKMEAVGQLAGGVAHDFNNLLTAILGNASLARIRGAGTGAPSDTHLEKIERACEQASELTTQLLTFSRKQVVEEVPLDLAGEIRRQKALIGPIIRDDVTLTTDLDPAAGVVLMNPGHVSQLLMNLLVNAVDAMPRGGELRLSTRAERWSQDGEERPWAVLSVRDDGIGMTDDVKARVLEPFFTTKPVGVGTGLGLATVYGIATGAGGRVEIESASGHGTTIEVWLPASDAAAVPSPETEVRDSTRVEGTVLLVEDDPAVLEATAALLKQSGLEVLKARNGRDALERVDAGAEFDVVVTDAVMAHVGGLELVRKLRESGADAGAVICSGYAADLGRADLEEVNAVFVAKPYKAAPLLEAIEGRILSRSPSR